MQSTWTELQVSINVMSRVGGALLIVVNGLVTKLDGFHAVTLLRSQL